MKAKTVSSASSVYKMMNQLPRAEELGNSLFLVVDSYFRNKPVMKNWISRLEKSAEVVVYWVQAGEELKNLTRFADHVLRIQKLLGPKFGKNFCIVGVGGGSVGDFSGFLASVYKRGVPHVQIPSTLLAAIDSAHGGKNGLNVGGVKNQIGTIYPPRRVLIVKELFKNHNPDRCLEAYGELYKMAWIQGGELWNSLNQMKRIDLESMWVGLPQAIAAKYKVVKKDPNETLGHRHILNLGHTMGHVFESYYHLPHGLAVLAGMDFAFFFSAQKKILKMPTEKIFAQPSSLLLSDELKKSRFTRLNYPSLLSIPVKDLKSLLLQDKKRVAGEKIRFVFPVKPGVCKIESVSVEELLNEYQRQKGFFFDV